MNTQDAFTVFYELATQNILSDVEVSQDPDCLENIQKQQLKACNIVHDFLVNHVFE